MFRRSRSGRPAVIPVARAVALVAVAAILAACSGSAKPNAVTPSTAGGSPSASTAAGTGATKVAITLTPEGCAPQPPSVPAGNTEFDVTNTNANKGSEADLKTADSSKTLGSVEHVKPGVSEGFSADLTAGSYVIVCPGAQQESWDLRVTNPDAGNGFQSNPELAAAVNGYAVWVRQEVAVLAARTKTFVAAVKADQIPLAQVLYGKARIEYESIEPVAESFGDLDKEIDGRVEDWVNPADFSGFHRIERALFQQKNLAGMDPFADRLLENINQLQHLVAKLTYSPIELASGATDLVNEIEESKITGEEERYSGIDLVDFRGNLSGAIELVHELTPFLAENDPSLLDMINARNRMVEAALDRYEASPGYDDTGFVNYATVTTQERRDLSEVINGLAEAISAMVVEVST